MGRNTAPGPPALGELGELPGRRTGLEPRRHLEGDLQRKVAGGETIGTAKTEHDVDVGGPWPDTADRGQGGVNLFLRHAVHSAKVQAAFDGVRNGPKGPNLARGQSDGSQLFVANGLTNDMTVVDIATLKPLRSVPVGRLPWGVAIKP